MIDASPAKLADAEARRRIREDLDVTLFVEAAAGTGKTSALVSRIVSLLTTGTGRLDQIAAVTFTEKAAGEMKLRLRAEIERARAAADEHGNERGRLEEALSQLELARIGTIHAFCGDLLHERPVEAGVDPLFEVAPTEEAEGLLDRAFEQWFQEALADPAEGVRRVLRRRPRGYDRAGPRKLLRGAVANLVDHRDFPAGWRREAFDRDGEIDAVMNELAAVGELATQADRADDWLAKNLEELRLFCEENRLRESVRGRDHDGLEAELREFARSSRTHWHWKGAPRRPYGSGLERSNVVERRDDVKRRLDALLAQCDADLASLLRDELRPVVAAYELQKEAAGRLDFLDLLVRARDLVRDDREIREELQTRFSHFFVDEFQDTDPLQAELLVLLASRDPEVDDWRQVDPIPGKLFLVGDPKQSIYRFRRADVAIYEGAKQQLQGRGAEVVHLSTSFRSLPSIQQAVNAAFEPCMQPGDRGTQAQYVALEPFRDEVGDRPSIVALPVPQPYGDYGRVTNWKIDRSLPDAVGAFVHWLVEESGWTIEASDGSGARQPIRARHICLLFRRFKSFGNDVTRSYVRGLEARRVPHVLVGGRSFHEREEVQALRNALGAIEWPDDELSVFATLRGPFFALSDDALLAYRHAIRPHPDAPLGRLHTLRRLDEAALDALDTPEREVADALAILRGLYRKRNHQPIAETLSELLAAVRAHAGVAIWPTGEQALANCLRVVDLARRFERRGAPSFRAFVDHLEHEAERGEAEDAPVVEEGTEGVRIMTVHRAKGLEFPVVILADPTANRVPRNPSRHIDPAAGLWAEPLCGCTPHELKDATEEELARDAEESLRVAYVAATRARELLVVPVVGDAEQSGWLDVLNPAVQPKPAERREADPAPGCPEFGADSVVDRGPKGVEDAERSVRPGLHVPQAGDHRVVWWDPAVLELGKEEQVGLRQEKILVADEGRTAESGIQAHADWQRARAEMLEAGTRPSLDVRSVTSLIHDLADTLAHDQDGPAATPRDVELMSVDTDRTLRPGGRRFGTLVHAILSEVPLVIEPTSIEPAPDPIEALAVQHGRLLGAPEGEIGAAVVAVRAALAHPLMLRAGASAGEGGLRRETPVLQRRDDGVLVEGIVDLAFREEVGGQVKWTVVDFKTDREIGELRGSYEAQVGLYVDAVEAATHEPVSGVLFLV